jgi:hypothetical protein
MDDLERQLKQALARESAPEWFEQKVMAAVSRRDAERRGLWRQLTNAARLRWAPVALAAGLVISGVAWQQQRALAEREAGIEAKKRLELALQVTGAKLHQIGREMRAINAAE